MKHYILRGRLTAQSFLQFATWGAYLTTMGAFLAAHGHGHIIGWFYSMQGIVSLFMPGLMGMVADRWIPAHRLLAICHLVAAAFMITTGVVGLTDASNVALLLPCYAASIGFFMPTIAISNAVAFNALQREGIDTVKVFPSIRIFGTVGFVCTMWAVDLCGLQTSAGQFVVSGVIGLLLGLYCFTLPPCPVGARRGQGGAETPQHRSLVQALGFDAFRLFRIRHMAVFFAFSMLLGISLQLTNSYANPFISSFARIPEYAHTFGAQHANILISLSQISETCCILLIPFCLSRLGIKRVILLAMMAWVLRFGLFALGDTGTGVWMFVLSCIFYGVAFDFFNISGALYVDRHTDAATRSSAQGLFMIMTNGFGATVGMLTAQAIVNRLVFALPFEAQLAGWRTTWGIFAAYALAVFILFALCFRENSDREATAKVG